MNSDSENGLPVRRQHCAVHLGNFIIVIGGVERRDKLVSTHEIWKYNLSTGGWKKLAPDKRVAPEPFYSAVAVAVEGSIYTFGGLDMKRERRNALWTLSSTEKGCFTWSSMKHQHEEESPSPRNGHTGWEYAGKLWVFGGEGPSPDGYLHQQGTFARSCFGLLANNQLLSYNPNTKNWTDPQYSGAVPRPRWGHASAVIGAKVFLFGGYIENQGCRNDFFQLDMLSLTWTKLGIGQPSPRHSCSLTATLDNQLVLHGGQSAASRTLNDTWLMDLTSYSWKQNTSMKYHGRQNHTATLGLNNNVIIVGGYKDFEDAYDSVFYIKFQPRSLQELASCIVYKHKADLPRQCLPQKLIALLDISADGQDS